MDLNYYIVGIDGWIYGKQALNLINQNLVIPILVRHLNDITKS